VNKEYTELLKYLSSKIQEEMTVMKDDMAMGKAKDFGDYKYAAGIYRGLIMANTILADTAERMKNE
jgi:hypothetical protein